MRAQKVSWLFTLLVLWTLFGLGQWLFLSLAPLSDEPVSRLTVQVLAVGAGVWCSLWLSFSQHVAFGTQPAWERVLWLALAMSGLWVMSFSRADLDCYYGELLYGITSLFGAQVPTPAKSPNGFPYWFVPLSIPAMLWFARPFFAWLTWDASGGRGPIQVVDLPRLGWGRAEWLAHPWVARCVALAVFGWWLRSEVDVRRIITETSGALILATVVLMGLAVVATCPPALAGKTRRSWVAWALITGCFGGVLGVGVGVRWLLEVFAIINPLAPEYFLFETLQWSLAAAITTGWLVLVVQWSVGFRPRVRAVIRSVGRANAGELAPAEITADRPVNNVRPDMARQPPVRSPAGLGSHLRIGPWIATLAVAGGLLIGIVGLRDAGHRSLNLCLWLFSDQNGWERGRLVAEIQRLQAIDPPDGKLVWDWRREPRTLMVDSVGKLNSGVTRAMFDSAGWPALRSRTEAAFPETIWYFDFPISRPEDTVGTAYGVLQIDAERLPLRELPEGILSLNWEVHGGDIQAADLARLHGLRFVRLIGSRLAADVDWMQLPSSNFRQIEFWDCDFARLPVRFPTQTTVRFYLDTLDHFLVGCPDYVESLHGGARILIRNPPADRPHESLFSSLDPTLRNLFEIQRTNQGWSISPAGALSLVQANGRLPPDLRWPELETDSQGRLRGLVARGLTLDSDVIPFDTPLDWLSFEPYFNYRDFGFFRNLIDNAKLVRIDSRAFMFAVISNLEDAETTDNSLEPRGLFISGSVEATLLESLKGWSSFPTLILEAQPMTPAHLAAVGKLPHIRNVILLTAQATPNPSEQFLQQQFETLPGLRVQTAPHTLERSELLELVGRP